MQDERPTSRSDGARSGTGERLDPGGISPAGALAPGKPARLRRKAPAWVWHLVILLAVAAGVTWTHLRHAAGNRAGERAFDGRGVILEIAPQEKTVRMRHEEIAGYMPAMVMPFAVKESALLNGLAAGDVVRFQLLVTEDDAWIGRLEKVGTVAVPNEIDPGAVADEVQPKDRIQIGEEVPEFSLVNQEGQTIKLSDFRGKAVVLTFFYTRCPLPTFCPLMSKNFALLQKELLQDIPGQFQLISITIDPEFDRPRVLKAYAASYAKTQESWCFVTGPIEQVDLLADRFGLIREKEGGLITHNLVTALLSPEGRLVQIWKRNEWTPSEVRNRLKEMLAARAPARQSADLQRPLEQTPPHETK